MYVPVSSPNNSEEIEDGRWTKLIEIGGWLKVCYQTRSLYVLVTTPEYNTMT